MNLFQVSDPSESRGSTVTAREVLDRGVEKIVTELKDQPEARATLMETMGTVYVKLGLYDKGIALTKEALAIRRSLFGNASSEVAKTLLILGTALYDRGDFGSSSSVLEEAVALNRQLHGPDDRAVAMSLIALAKSLYHSESNKYAKMESIYREAIGILRKLPDEEIPIAEANNGLAGLLYAQEKIGEAETLYKEVLEVRRRHYGNDDLLVAGSLHNVGMCLHTRKDHAGAEAAMREALAIRRKLLGPDHPDVGRLLQALGIVLRDAGNNAAAEVALKESLGILTKTLGTGNVKIAHTKYSLAKTLKAENRLAEADSYFREAVPVLRHELPPQHPSVITSLEDWGDLLVKMGNHAAAVPLFRAELAGLNQTTSDETTVADAESQLAGCLIALHQLDEAETLLLKAYGVQAAHGAKEWEFTRGTLKRLVALYQARRQPKRVAEFQAHLDQGEREARVVAR
jgi:tetratricopeptide (TPR) repeat protein